VGSYLAEEIVDGVGEVLEAVVTVSELGGGDGVGTEQEGRTGGGCGQGASRGPPRLLPAAPRLG